MELAEFPVHTEVLCVCPCFSLFQTCTWEVLFLSRCSLAWACDDDDDDDDDDDNSWATHSWA